MIKPCLLFILCTLHPISSYALSDQVTQAQHFLQNTNDSASNTIHSFILPKSEIRYGQHNTVLNDFQTQVNLPVTGIFDKDTLDFVQQEQEKLGFNVTRTLDLNTWSALYEEPVEWQKKVTSEAINQWQNILSKQSSIQASKFIVVNIPSMTLKAYDWDGTNATEALKSRVVVGKPNTQTPMHDFEIWAIKYNPTWTPTANIIRRAGNSQAWFKRHHLKALDERGHVVSYDTPGAHFVQPAGNTNALGILKFETTSSENIYLHDTNEKNLFNFNTRAYSSGCVRVQNFQELAMWVNNMDENTLNEKLANKNTRVEKIAQKVPVYFTYSQIEFDNGEPLFAPDIYHRQRDN